MFLNDPMVKFNPNLAIFLPKTKTIIPPSIQKPYAGADLVIPTSRSLCRAVGRGKWGGGDKGADCPHPHILPD